MTIEIIKGEDNAVAAFFSATTQTPETDKNTWSDSSEGILYKVVSSDFARKLERERDEAIRLLIEASEYSTTTSQENTEKFLRKIGKWEEAK